MRSTVAPAKGGSEMAVMWLSVIDKGMPKARRKWLVSSLVECRFAPRKYGVFGGFSHSGETKSMKARRAPNEYALGPLRV